MKMSRKELFLKYVWSVFADKSENVDTDGALCVVFSYTIKVHCPGSKMKCRVKLMLCVSV